MSKTPIASGVLLSRNKRFVRSFLCMFYYCMTINRVCARCARNSRAQARTRGALARNRGFVGVARVSAFAHNARIAHRGAGAHS